MSTNDIAAITGRAGGHILLTDSGYYKGSQSIERTLVLLLRTGSATSKRVELSIKRDSLDRQSIAKARVWSATNDQWNVLTVLDGELPIMKALPSYVAKLDDATVIASLNGALGRLFRDAQAILS
jgi:hypothetical protein